MTIGLTVYACCTSTDFTYCGGFLFMCLFLLIGMGIIVRFYGFDKDDVAAHITLSSISAIVYGFYLIYDT